MIYAGPRCKMIMSDNGNEVASHGDESFPILGYDETLSAAPGGGVPWHWHADFEAILGVEADLTVHVGENSLELAPGDAVFVNTNRPHAVETTGTGRLRSAVYSGTLVSGGRDTAIHRRYVQPIVDADGLDLVVFRKNDKGDASATAHLAQAIDALEKEGDGFEIEAREHLSLFMVEILKRLDAPKTRPKAKSVSSERAAQMCDYIAEHYAQGITAVDIAAAGGVSEREALRCFTREFGVGPSRYLMIKRLSCAAELLAGTPMPISEVARAVGIQSPSNFAQLFRRDYHCTPREYRQHLRG